MESNLILNISNHVSYTSNIYFTNKSLFIIILKGKYLILSKSEIKTCNVSSNHQNTANKSLSSNELQTKKEELCSFIVNEVYKLIQIGTNNQKEFSNLNAIFNNKDLFKIKIEAKNDLLNVNLYIDNEKINQFTNTTEENKTMISDKIYQSYDLSNLDPFENNIISEFEKFQSHQNNIIKKAKSKNCFTIYKTNKFMSIKDDISIRLGKREAY